MDKVKLHAELDNTIIQVFRTADAVGRVSAHMS